MNVLVTGAAGFIGSHVVDVLCERGAKVIALDSLDPQVHRQAPDYLRGDVDYCFADLRQWQPDSRFAEVEAVVHLAALGGVARAAREPANLIEANCGGTARLVEAMRAWPRLRITVLGSSFSVYGSNYEYLCPRCGRRRDGQRGAQDLDHGIYDVLCPQCRVPANIQAITESATPRPLETYGASKYMQELCFRGFSQGAVNILRFSSVYGARLRLDDGEATIIAKLAGWIRAGQRPTLLEDGQQIRDWVYVGDLVEAVMALLEGKGATASAVMNICCGVPVTLEQACHHLARAMGAACQPEIIGGYRPGDMRHCLGEAGGLRRLLGRDPIALEAGAMLAFGHSEVPRVEPLCGREPIPRTREKAGAPQVKSRVPTRSGRGTC